MDNNSKFKSAINCAEKTQALLSKYQIPPTPVNYSVFYIFSDESNPKLNEKINEQLTRKSHLDDVFLEGLFSEFISNSDQLDNDVLTPLNNSITHLMTKIDEQVSFGEETVNNLEKVDSALGKNKQAGSLQQLASYMFNSLARTNNQHKSLSKELSKAQREMKDLKEQLDISRKEAILDSLTGLLNRRGGDQKLKEFDLQEVQTSLAIDIDHFKSVNDNFGHFIGDRVIQRVAKTIQEKIAQGDLAIRSGGEEFTVVLKNTTSKEAKIVADNIRTTISNLKLKQKNSSNFLPKISVSVGIAQNNGESNWIDLFKRADNALYQAKNSGRDCSIIAQ